ncbi:tripartite tricarboxylate transporter TctB family protein [Sporomusa aerivorans]|uniref:tripartite tricarboxylate transporter TctB family protein n=1 Tax=Sporomusa aerivorans TaxID=204936 RepID=UPI00352B1EE6
MMLNKIIISAHLACAAGYLLVAGSLPLGTLKAPGAGLFPLIIGILWAAVSLFALANRRGEENNGDSPDGADSARVFKVSAAIVIYTLLLPVIGFSLSTFLTLMYVSYLMGNHSRVTCLGFSLAGVFLSVLIFQWLLQLSLPEPLLTMLDF